MGSSASAKVERQSTPDALFADLTFIDRKLNLLIRDEKDGVLDSHELVARTNEIKKAKQEMVDQFFAQATPYGLAFSEVFKQLDCLDSQLSLGLGEGINNKGPLGNDTIVKNFKLGQKCKQKLETELHQASGLPEGTLNVDPDLKHIDAKLTQLIKAEGKGSGLGSHELAARTNEIKKAKQAMVDEFFAQATPYGLAFSEVFKQLDCLDSQLSLGLGEGINNKGPLGSDTVAKNFKLGKKCKQKLEDELHAAQTQPPGTPLDISPISATFVEADRATTYTVPTVTDDPPATITYKWTLSLEAVDPTKGVDAGCNNHGVLTGTDAQFVWHHGNVGDPVHDDGCDHMLQGQYGHQGLITVEVSDSRGAKCTATYKGTNTSDASSVTNGVASTPVCTQPSQ